MQPRQYEFEHKGHWTTIRTCGGPVGAYCGFTGESPRKISWQYVNARETIVNGTLVRERYP